MALPRGGTNFAEYLRFQCTFFQKKWRDLINKPISNVSFSSYKTGILWCTALSKTVTRRSLKGGGGFSRIHVLADKQVSFQLD